MTDECSDWTQNRVCTDLKYSLTNANRIIVKDIISSLILSFISLAVGCIFLGTWLCASRRPILNSCVPSPLELERGHYLSTYVNFQQKKISNIENSNKIVVI
jgi:hypothetical protein